MKGVATMTMGLGAMLLLSACGGDNGETMAAANTADASAPVEVPAAPATPVAAATVAPVGSAQDQSLDAFWAKFRKAALANDAAGIAALSAPTVIQHGDLDDSPKHRLTPAQVEPVLKKLLDNPDNVDGNGWTQRQLLEATRTARLDQNWAKDRVRIGDMEFALGKDGWRLDQIYYEAYE